MKKNTRITFYLFVFVLLLSVVIYPPDYYFVAKWVTGTWKDDVVLQTGPAAPFLYKNTRAYYHAVFVGEKDIEKGIELLHALLEKKLSRRLHEKVLYLLGEFYFVSKRYGEASEYLWELLKKNPKNDLYRQNYEFVRVLSGLRDTSANEEISTQIEEENSGLLEGSIRTLEPIQESTLYFTYINDTEEKSDLPQW